MRVALGFLFFFVLDFSEPVDKNYLLGKFNPSADGRFTRLTKDHASGSAIGGYLRTEAYDAFIKMQTAAKKENVNLVIISATRNFESQRQIWENKWKGATRVEGKDLSTIKNAEERAKIILRYSSMPGSSRHHWGTDMDLNSLVNSYFESGQGLKAHQWLTSHAGEYGFCQPYTSKSSGRTGYEEEKWHWSYRPLSGELLKEFILQVDYHDISGFKGSEVAQSLRIIEDYVQGIACTE